MAGVDLLRPSRDGDQFHYRWAARQSLRLLRPSSELTAIHVEGAAVEDPDLGDGEEVIDLADYYGGTALADANRVVYRQLKHSTRQTEDEFTVSGLKKTLQGFGTIYRKIKAENADELHKVRFEFVSNRQVRSSVLEAINLLASGAAADPEDHDVRYLRQYSGFSADAGDEAAFFKRFSIDTSAPGLLRLDSIFHVEVGSYLPHASDVEHILLKEMIERRATSLEPDSLVTRSTVLMALRTSEVDLLPCPSLIEAPEHLIVTEQAEETIQRIVEISDRPVIVHAAGGVGKSVLTTRIQQGMPDGSLALVFDCFGNGDYRRTSQPRHPHRKGLLHLANELATHSLCDPLIPVRTAQPEDYSRAFLARVRTAAAALEARTPGALLAIVIDAADNAAQVAGDIGERTFVTDMMLESMPANVRLVMLCRTERIDLLKPPAGTPRLELTGFTLQYTHGYLNATFDSVSDAQATEFHRRTGGNPRIQAFAAETSFASGHDDIESCLLALGEPRPGYPVDLDDLLQDRLDACKNEHPAASASVLSFGGTERTITRSRRPHHTVRASDDLSCADVPRLRRPHPFPTRAALQPTTATAMANCPARPSATELPLLSHQQVRTDAGRMSVQWVLTYSRASVRRTPGRATRQPSGTEISAGHRECCCSSLTRTWKMPSGSSKGFSVTMGLLSRQWFAAR